VTLLTFLVLTVNRLSICNVYVLKLLPNWLKTEYASPVSGTNLRCRWYNQAVRNTSHGNNRTTSLVVSGGM